MPPPDSSHSAFSEDRSFLTQGSQTLWAPISPSTCPYGGLQAPHNLALSPLCSHPCTHSAPATLVSLLFFKPTSRSPASGPLHWLILLPGMLLPQITTWLTSSSPLCLESSVTFSVKPALTPHFGVRPSHSPAASPTPHSSLAYFATALSTL